MIGQQATETVEKVIERLPVEVQELIGAAREERAAIARLRHALSEFAPHHPDFAYAVAAQRRTDEAISALAHAERSGSGGAASDAQIKHMVDRFLGWRLPDDFNPDAGISFKAEFNEHTAHPMKHEPSGTNLFNAQQAEAMVRHMIEGLSAFSPSPKEETAHETVRKIEAQLHLLAHGGGEYVMPAKDRAELAGALQDALAHITDLQCEAILKLPDDKIAKLLGGDDAVLLSANKVDAIIKLAREEKSHERTIDQRDEAEEAMSQAYFLVTGQSPEWSNKFGYEQALEEIGDALALLKGRGLPKEEGTREAALHQEFYVGDEVRVGPSCKYFGDWQRARLRIVGVRLIKHSREADYEVADIDESGNLLDHGTTDGFVASDFVLVRRASLPPDRPKEGAVEALAAFLYKLESGRTADLRNARESIQAIMRNDAREVLSFLANRTSPAPPSPPRDAMREALAALFVDVGLCASRGEFVRHLRAGAVRLGIGAAKAAVVNEETLALAAEQPADTVKEKLG